MAVFKVAWAGIKKRKVYSISIFLLIFMIALLLNMGVSLIQRVSQIYDETHYRSNAIHIQYTFDEMFEEKVKELGQWFEKDDRINVVKVDHILNLHQDAFNHKNKGKAEHPVNLYPETERVMNRDNEMIELDLGYDEIALPLYYHNKYHLEKGDPFEIPLDNTTISLKIDSFFVDPVYGSESVGMKNLIINKDRLKDLIENSRNTVTGQSRIKGQYNIGIVVKEQFIKNIKEINDDFYDNNNVPMNISYTFELYKTGTLFMPNIILIVMIAFSILLFLIIVFVIRNAINSAIETEFTNIGILKSLGFSSSQIRLSIILQFSILTVMGTIMGVSMSILLIPILGNIVLATTGLTWIGYPSVLMMLFVAFVLLVLINCLVYSTSNKVMKISPVEAISGGKKDVYYKPYINIPLSKLVMLPLSLRIGLKQILTRVKQYIMLILISCVLALALGITLIAVNMFNDIETTLKVFGAENINIGITGLDEESVETIIEEIADKYDVLHYDLVTTGMVSVGSASIRAMVYKDFEKSTINPIQGRFPKYDNEVSMTKVLSRRLDKKIGDTIIISDVTGEKKLAFIITGYHQNINDVGNNIYISADGFKRIDKEAQLRTGELLIDEKLDMDKILYELEEKYENKKNGIDISRYDYEDTIITTYKSMLSGVVLGIGVLVALIISIITMFLAFIAIYKENRELGVYKALGYDTFQIRLQFAARFAAVTFIGTLIGSTLSSAYGVKLLEIMMSAIGIGRLQFYFNLTNLLIPIGLVSTVAFSVALMASKRIKKVSPRDLIYE